MATRKQTANQYKESVHYILDLIDSLADSEEGSALAGYSPVQYRALKIIRSELNKLIEEANKYGNI